MQSPLMIFTHFFDTSEFKHYNVKLILKYYNLFLIHLMLYDKRIRKKKQRYSIKIIYYKIKWHFYVLHCRQILYCLSHQFSSVQFSRSVVSDSLRPHEPQHARPPCPSPTPRVYSNLCPSSRWCHPAISSSVFPFSSCPQSLPASGSFPMSQLFAWGGQSIGVSASASVLPMNTQDWSSLGWTGWIPLQSKGLSRVFSNTTL